MKSIEKSVFEVFHGGAAKLSYVPSDINIFVVNSVLNTPTAVAAAAAAAAAV